MNFLVDGVCKILKVPIIHCLEHEKMNLYSGSIFGTRTAYLALRALFSVRALFLINISIQICHF